MYGVSLYRYLINKVFILVPGKLINSLDHSNTEFRVCFRETCRRVSQINQQDKMTPLHGSTEVSLERYTTDPQIQDLTYGADERQEGDSSHSFVGVLFTRKIKCVHLKTINYKY